MKPQPVAGDFLIEPHGTRRAFWVTPLTPRAQRHARTTERLFFWSNDEARPFLLSSEERGLVFSGKEKLAEPRRTQHRARPAAAGRSNKKLRTDER